MGKMNLVISPAYASPPARLLPSLTRVIDSAYHVTSPDTYRDLFVQLGQAIPFAYSASGIFDLHLMGSKVSHAMYPDLFLGDYLTQCMGEEPSLRGTLSGHGPIVTSYVDSKDQDGLAAEIKRRSGIKQCLSMAFTGEMGKVFYIAFSNFSPRLRPDMELSLRFLAPHLYSACVRSTAPWEQEEERQSPFPLTPQQHRVLFWKEQGKTNQEVAMILGIRERTVRYHMEQIFNKHPSGITPLMRWRLVQTSMLNGVS